MTDPAAPSIFAPAAPNTPTSPTVARETGVTPTWGLKSSAPTTAAPINTSRPTADTTTAAANLRAFEDKHLGRRAIRSKDGHVEKGYGSPFKAMTPEQHAEHAALEKMVEAEARVDEANIALSVAKVAVEEAKANAAAAAKVSEAAAVEAKKVADEEAREAKRAADEEAKANAAPATA